MSRAPDASTTAARSSVHCSRTVRSQSVIGSDRPTPAAVEDDHTTERTQPVEQTGEPGLLLEQLERDQPTRHHHDVAGRLGGRVRVEHPVRDVRPVVGLGVENVDHDLESRTMTARCPARGTAVFMKSVRACGPG